LFLACAFSGSLSTISSGLNSMAAVIIEDIYKGLMRRKLNRDQQGFVSKLCSVVVGVIVMLLTYFISYLGSVINAAISLSSTLCGPIMGVFFLGFFFPKANRLGALIGFFSSLALQIWIFIGVQLTKHQRSNNRLPLSIANCTDINVLEIMNSSRTTTAATHINHPLKPHEIDSKLIIRLDDLRRYCCCSKQQRKSTNSVVSGEVSTKQQRSKDTDIELTTSLTIQ
ncbi:unnamed protein product, partial [Adineta steineri]